MRKVLSILLIGLMLCSSAFAVEYMSTDKGKTLLTYVSANATGAYITPNISTSTIVPGTHRIIGFELMIANAALTEEMIVGLYDTTTDGGMASTAIFDEAEAANDTQVIKWYPYPKELSNGLSLVQGPNSVVVIYYDRK